MKRISIGGYYGGKQSMLLDLLPHFAIRHDIYVELFAGSAAVLLNKPRARIEILNDLAGEITTFWRCLRDHPDELQRVIDATPPGEAALREIIDAPPTDDDIEVARRWWCRTELSYAHIPTGRTNTLCQSSLYVAARRGLDAVAHRIRDVRVENTDAARLIDRAMMLARHESDSPPLFYADPPYVPATRASGTGLYLVDPAGEDALAMHRALLDAVESAAASGARFVISGYASALYDERLTVDRGWRRFEVSKPVTTPRRANNLRPGAPTSKRRATEIIWRNFPVRRNGPAPDPLWQMVRNRRGR